MKKLTQLFKNNQQWAAEVKRVTPDFFTRIAHQQAPEYLWIGCSDSRVPANQIAGLLPGEIFVHRNIANVVVHTDLNCLSVIQFAVEILKVRHIIVCGHYGCGGIKAALDNTEHGLIDNWLRHIKDVYRFYEKEMDKLTDGTTRQDRLCELNILEQVSNVCTTTIVQNAWKEKRDLTVHGLIYNVEDGLLKDLGVSASDNSDVSAIHKIH